MEDREGKNDKVSRRVWKKVEDRKIDKTRVEEARGNRRKREEKTNDRGRKNDSKNSRRKGE